MTAEAHLSRRVGETQPAGKVSLAALSSPNELIGQTLRGTYLIKRAIAIGGMGVVYEAEHVRLRGRVAIKIVLRSLEKRPEVMARFRREAEIVAQLGHPHIVKVFDVDETDAGEPYIVMELLVGRTLADRLDEAAPLPVLEALRVTSQVASALASAHARGVVHRDLKPENVFLVRVDNEPDFVKVLDFGISKVTSSRSNLTAERSVIGTPGYMAPEQATANRGVDHRADQFALACIAYELLSGSAPFQGENPAATLYQVVHEQPSPMSRVAPWLPGAFDAVIARALSKDPLDRFASISRFAWALENAAATAGMGEGRRRTTEPRTRSRQRTLRETGAGSYRVSTPRSERISQTERTPPPPRSSSGPHSVRDAGRLVDQARAALEAGEHDDAVGWAEKVMELLVYGGDPSVFKSFRGLVPLLDEIFSTRVGGTSVVVRPGTAARAVRSMNLSPRAAALLALVEGPMTVADVLEQSGMPRRDAIRLLAGLLRRGALTRH